MTNPINILGAAEKAMDFADDSFESREEAENARTERHKIDNTSPFELPHLIRPYSFIWAMANETILTWATIAAVFFADDIDPNASLALIAALTSNSAILATIIGFYFNSRKVEKVTAKKAMVAVEMQRDKMDSDIKLELLKTKAEIKAKKKAKRKEERRLQSE